MTGIDANVLVALAAQSHPSHSQAVTVFERDLAAHALAHPTGEGGRNAA
jgi:predicted nucleic acid-binding protein